MMLGLESTGSRMSNLSRQELYFGKFFTMDEMIAKIEAVTADEIAAITREFFQTGTDLAHRPGPFGRLEDSPGRCSPASPLRTAQSQPGGLLRSMSFEEATSPFEWLYWQAEAPATAPSSRPSGPRS